MIVNCPKYGMCPVYGELTLTVNMIFVDRHLQRNSNELECESPVWQHMYFHH